MMINGMAKNVLFTSLLLLNASVQAATVSVYGAEQGQKLTASHQTQNQYIIQMGLFENKQYATELRDRLARKTNQTVHLLHHEDASVPYVVFLGPFNDVETVNQVSREILGEQVDVSHAQSMTITQNPISHTASSVLVRRKTFGHNRRSRYAYSQSQINSKNIRQ